MPFATACCGIELMATGAAKHDLARFGAEVFRFSPRQCDSDDRCWSRRHENATSAPKNLATNA